MKISNWDFRQGKTVGKTTFLGEVVIVDGHMDYSFRLAWIETDGLKDNKFSRKKTYFHPDLIGLTHPHVFLV